MTPAELTQLLSAPIVALIWATASIINNKTKYRAQNLEAEAKYGKASRQDSICEASDPIQVNHYKEHPEA